MVLEKMVNKEAKDIQVTFTNYNYAFESFYSEYKNVCLEIISDNNLLNNIQSVSLFFYEYDYAISDTNKRRSYHSKLLAIRKEIEHKKVLVEMSNNKGRGIEKRTENIKIYFDHLIRILEVLSLFVSELTSSFMPRTNLQKKKIRFANNQIFFQKLSEVKKLVMEELANFKVTGFVKPYKTFLVYFAAYRLYVNNQGIKRVSKLLSLCLSFYCHADMMNVFRRYPQVSEKEGIALRKVNDSIRDCLSLSNSILNQSFSDYGILPKLNEKVLIDTTGI